MEREGKKTYCWEGATRFQRKIKEKSGDGTISREETKLQERLLKTTLLGGRELRDVVQGKKGSKRRNKGKISG